jgi:hypothetical protein
MNDEEPFFLTHMVSRFLGKNRKKYTRCGLILETDSYSYSFLFGLKLLFILRYTPSMLVIVFFFEKVTVYKAEL